MIGMYGIAALYRQVQGDYRQWHVMMISCYHWEKGSDSQMWKTEQNNHSMSAIITVW